MRIFFKFASYFAVTIALSSAHAGSYEAFFRAVNVDNVSTVSELLKEGFDPNTVSEKGQVGLYLALRDGSPKVVGVLLAQPGIRLDAVNAAGETPLMMAALKGEVEWARRMIDQGAQINRKGWTPLHYAASGPEPKVVALLLDRGAEIEARSPNQTTPLMMASRYGPEESVDLLLARGASKAMRNEQQLNAADFARLGGRESLAARLREAGR